MTSAASRLCQSCGLCCNGVLFHGVRVLPSDSTQALQSLGIVVHHKKREPVFDQPCVAFKKNCCSIYAQRPTRCRLFECQQLKKVAASERAEIEASELILAAKRQVEDLIQLMENMGRFNRKRPLFKEVEKFLMEAEISGEEDSITTVALKKASHDLQNFLNKEFRIVPLNL